MHPWLKAAPWIALALAVLLGALWLMLDYNRFVISQGEQPPFTPWGEMQLLAGLLIGWLMKQPKGNQ